MAKSRDNIKPLKRVARDTLFYLGATVIPAVINFISVPIYTRLFRPEDFGYYSIATTTISLLTAVFSGWLAQVALRFYESNKRVGKLHAYHSTIFFSLVVITICSSVLLLLLVLALNTVFSKPFSLILILSILCFAVNGFYKVYLAVLRASQQPRFYGLIEISNSAVRIGVALLAILLLGMGVEGILYGILLSTIVTLWFVIKKLRLKSFLSSEHFSRDRFMEYFRFGYPASFALISSWLMVLSSRYVIGLVQNSREVGLYSVSSQLSDRPLRLLLTGIMLAAYPIIVEIWESKGRESTEELINKLSRYYIILITPFLILLCIFAKEIVLLVSTREYVDGARAIPFIAVGIFFFGLMQYVSKGFELKKLTSQMAAIMWSAGILNLVLTFILVSKFGFVGAAISMMISYIFLFSCFLHRIGPHLTWTIPFKSLYRILVAALILVSFLLVTKSFMTEAVLMLIIASFSGLLIYGGILILTGEISRREVQALVGLFRTPKADNQVG